MYSCLDNVIVFGAEIVFVISYGTAPSSHRSPGFTVFSWDAFTVTFERMVMNWLDLLLESSSLFYIENDFWNLYSPDSHRYNSLQGHNLVSYLNTTAYNSYEIGFVSISASYNHLLHYLSYHTTTPSIIITLNAFFNSLVS